MVAAAPALATIPPCALQFAFTSAIRALDRSSDYADLILQVSNRHFLDMQAPLPDGSSNPLPVALIYRRDQSFSLLLSAYVRGIQDSMAAEWTPKLLASLKAVYGCDDGKAAEYLSEVLRRLKIAAEDPDVFLRYIQMELETSVGAKVSWPDLFLRAPGLVQKAPAVLSMRHPVYPDRPYAWTRAQQIMLAQNVYGNTVTRPGDNVLEVGYGSPAALVALASVLPGLNFTGVDIQTIPAGANEALGNLRIQLLQGNVPTDPSALQAVRNRGPYTVIYAGDALFPATSADKYFDPKVDGAEYAKFLYSVMTDGGHLVVLNDFARQPYFTEQEARAAGFNVVRWNVRRRMPEAAIVATRLAQPPQFDSTELGELRLFVLRKGDVRTDRIETYAKRVGM